MIMEEDLIFVVRRKEYKEWFIDYIKTELDKRKMSYFILDVISVIQLIELDNLEKLLFNKYQVEFTKYISSELLNI